MTEKQQKDWRRVIVGRGKGAVFREMMRTFNASEHIHVPSQVVAREEKVMLYGLDEDTEGEAQGGEVAA